MFDNQDVKNPTSLNSSENLTLGACAPATIMCKIIILHKTRRLHKCSVQKPYGASRGQSQKSKGVNRSLQEI